MKIKIIAFVFLLFYGLGLLFPTTFWATHFMSFLPNGLGYVLFLIAALIVIIPEKLVTFKMRSNLSFNNATIWGIAIICAILFYSFPIAHDIYGDAYRHAPETDKILKELPEGFYSELFSLKPIPSNGRKSVLMFFGWLSHTLDVKYLAIFKWIGILCGLLYVASWGYFVKKLFDKTKTQVLFMFLGITTPMMQFFFLHIETYALVNLLFLWWLMLWVSYLKEGKNKKLLYLIPFTLLLWIKIHPTFVLLAIALGVSVINKMFAKNIIANWKVLFFKILLPIFLVGAVTYFFILEDYKDPRYLDDAKDIDRLFLPILSPEAPLDRYNLLSWNHIFDYILVIFQWAAPAFFLLIIIFAKFRKSINWNTPQIIYPAFLLILYVALFFMVNPLLSIPGDWDLFCIPTTLFIVWVSLVYKNAGMDMIQMKIVKPILAISLCVLPTFIVNANTKMISYRLESANIHVFKTYYSHASDRLLVALSLLNEDRDLYIDRKNKLLSELKPYALKGKDEGYGNLLYDNALFYFDDGDFLLAKKFAKRALTYDSIAHRNRMLLLQANFQLKLKEEAYTHAIELMKYKFPNDEMARKVAIQMALETDKTDKSMALCQEYMKLYPNDAFVSQILRKLKARVPTDEIKALYYE